jgi:uncharacterized membrane protein SpoIIM required for sporulation
MTQEQFVATRMPRWTELDALCREAGRRPERLGPARVLRLAALYRSAAADLAYARRRFRGEPVCRQLETLVGSARTVVYDAPSRRGTLRAFATHGYWRLVADRPWPLAISWLLMIVPAALCIGWALHDPAAADGLVPGALRAVTRHRAHGADLGLGSTTKSAFASSIFTHNIEVTFEAFALGLTACLGTAYVLLTNGMQLGVVGGLAAGSGNGRVFFELVYAHGVLELSCIAVCGAAGLRLGWGLVAPGRRSRRDALEEEGRASVQIVLGTMPWLVVAGLTEGFVTPSGLGLIPVIVIGSGLAAIYWALVWRLGVRGREAVTPALAPSPAGTR